MVGVYVGGDLANYGFEDHPFGRDRHNAFWHEAQRRGLDQNLDIFSPPPHCEEEDLRSFHTSQYVSRLVEGSATGVGYLDYGDTPAIRGILEAVKAIVGANLDAIGKMVRGEVARVFVPIGGMHHATREQAAGFCAVNDIAIVIQALRERFGIQRVAYIDIDAHHGDGVQYSFNSDPDLIFADIHEDGRFLYPGTGFADETGEGSAIGTKLNLPVLPDSTDDEFFKKWDALETFIRASKPEIILFQAGADSIDGDPLTHMRFTPKAHAHAAKQLCKIANEFCDGRIISWGGGGYNLRNISEGWCAVVKSMVETES